MHSTPTREATVRFPERFRLRAPRGLSAALELAAGRRHTTPANARRLFSFSLAYLALLFVAMALDPILF